MSADETRYLDLSKPDVVDNSGMAYYRAKQRKERRDLTWRGDLRRVEFDCCVGIMRDIWSGEDTEADVDSFAATLREVIYRCRRRYAKDERKLQEGA